MKPLRVISIGGSIIIPKTGFSVSFLKKFRTLLLEEVKQGARFLLIIGGGATARIYQDGMRAVLKPSNTELDEMGVQTTILNAHFVRFLLQEKAYEKIVTYPFRRIHTKKPIIVAAGWRAGSSSDLRAVQLAHTYGATEVINASNIDYVYTKNPATHADAKPLTHISWKDFRNFIAPGKWEPGKNTPFDPVASRYAQEHGMRVLIVNGTKLSEFKKAIRGEKFRGTIIA